MNGHVIHHIELLPYDNQRLAKLCGEHHQYLRKLEKAFSVTIHHRGNQFKIEGEELGVQRATELLNKLYEETNLAQILTEHQVHLYIRDMNNNPPQNNPHTLKDENVSENETHVELRTKFGVIKGFTANQRQYLRNIQQYDINFSIGPAGTGKTYLAVASAVDALEKGKIKRLLLVRPAVEAGEKLGFLPGTLEEKISPYLRPLYDALFEMLGFERVEKLIGQNIIEIAPLAYMRGRTLNDSFIILDESQNTTIEQMKMFLTRIGFNSKAIITGDITQIDLPRGKKSGLSQAIDVLSIIPEICFTWFGSKDVVRHPLVQKIVEAYDTFDKKSRDPE